MRRQDHTRESLGYFPLGLRHRNAGDGTVDGVVDRSQLTAAYKSPGVRCFIPDSRETLIGREPVPQSSPAVATRALRTPAEEL